MGYVPTFGLRTVYDSMLSNAYCGVYSYCMYTLTVRTNSVFTSILTV